MTTAGEDEAAALAALADRLASLGEHVAAVRASTDAELAALRREADAILDEIRALSLGTVASGEVANAAHPAIPDDRLRRVWLVLRRYSNGTTADAIAADLHRHRTTISTYLNTLVLMGFARKERQGHAIVYTAIVKSDRAES